MVIATLRVTAFSLVMILITGLAYPFIVTGFAQAIFPTRSNGSLIEENGKIIGSELIAQNFSDARYFHPRPSGAGAGYEANNSGASNLGVTSKALNDTYNQRIAAQKFINTGAEIPVDLVAASGSGLDPHITPDAAYYQAQRVATARGLAVEKVHALIADSIESPTLGLLGMPRVNVLLINRELDKMPAE